MSDTEIKKPPPAGQWVISTENSIGQYRCAFTFISVLPSRDGGRRLELRVDGESHVFDLDPVTANFLSARLAVPASGGMSAAGDALKLARAC